MGGELQAKMTMSMTITGPDSESMIIYGMGIQNYRGVGDSFSNAITMWDSFFHPETANSNTCKHFNMRQSQVETHCPTICRLHFHVRQQATSLVTYRQLSLTGKMEGCMNTIDRHGVAYN